MTVCRCAAVLVVTLSAVTLAEQQMPDRSFRPMIEDRAYAIGAGPARWVRDGGSLLLLLDQDSLSPASELAAAFGVEFTNASAAPTTFRCRS